MSKTPSSPQDFKKKRATGVHLELPSGMVIKVRGVDLVSLVVSGKIPNALLATVQGHLSSVDPEATTEEATKLAENMKPEELAEVFSVMDTLVIACAMEPQVHPVPEDEGQRSEDLLYIDEIEGEDKLFIFNWSQEGLNDLKRFPERAAASMAALEEVGSVDAAPLENSGVSIS